MKSRPARYVWQDSRNVQTLVRTLRTHLSLVAAPAVQEHRQWLDSFDGRLYRQNTALSFTPTPAGGTLSWMRWPDGPRLHTLTIAAPPPRFPTELPESPLRQALVDLLEVRALLPLVTVQRRLRPFRVVNAHGKTLATLVLAEPGQATAPHRPRARLRGFVQIMPLKGYEAETAAVADLLTSRCALEAVHTAPLEEALEALGLRPDAGFVPFRVRLEPDQPAFEAVRTLLRPLRVVMRLNEPGIVADLDVEFLHDFRVALRRTRSALGQMKAIFPAAPLARFRHDFKWLSDLTSPARDFDVYLLWISTYQQALAETERPDLEPLITLLHEQRAATHALLRKALHSPRYRRLLADWEVFLDGPAPDDLPDPATRPILEVASQRLARLYDRVIAHGSAITDETPAEVLHQLRITCKKLRYLIEFFRSLYPPRRMDPLVRTLRQVQENLGVVQDLAVQRTLLHDLDDVLAARGLLTEATHYQINRLMETLDAQQQSARATFAEVFARFARARPPRLLRQYSRAL